MMCNVLYHSATAYEIMVLQILPNNVANLVAMVELYLDVFLFNTYCVLF